MKNLFDSLYCMFYIHIKRYYIFFAPVYIF